MGPLLKLVLFLLSTEGARALHCYQCRSYTENVCDHEMEECEVKDDEFCAIRRIWKTPYSLFAPQTAQSMCAKTCKNRRKVRLSVTDLMTCCQQPTCNQIDVLPKI